MLTPMFRFETGQASDVGRCRSVNEDGFLSSPESGFWAVADGMGGHAAGDFASQAIVRELASIGRPAGMADLRARVLERLARANTRILDQSDRLSCGVIGSTIVALLVHGPEFTCLWAGDSRAYRLRGSALRPLTRDHTEARELIDTGTITEEEARAWPGRNIITRAIGVTETPDCDRMEGEIAVGDVFLLCSDGLTEHLDDSEIAWHLARPIAVQAICEALIADTLERGARDNVTVVVTRCVGRMPGTPHPPMTKDLFP
ncbi:PP2C family protein-serine/threonine phosphatase [Roseivivax sediminis]|uniref:Protein phosphatase n=1 Tax=Roseivivax sediminis TaxID=936889 RepID=A0A1I1ZAC5_9RHOB|nr:protein phosphatase 2C domain-containing protein [Roseivivax sediminis]SFE28637.1 protein phosphatase [Roseivivax sediminis]